MDHLIEPSQLSRERGSPSEGPESGGVTGSLWPLSDSRRSWIHSQGIRPPDSLRRRPQGEPPLFLTRGRLLLGRLPLLQGRRVQGRGGSPSVTRSGKGFWL